MLGKGCWALDIDVGTLRELLRHLKAWRTLWEDTRTDLLPTPSGCWISLWDIEYMVEHGLPLLPARQAQAIRLCLIDGMKEKEAAVFMGVSETNPVAMYATTGLRKLIVMMDEGTLRPIAVDMVA